MDTPLIHRQQAPKGLLGAFKSRLEPRKIHVMAFSILIQFLEHTGPDSFLRCLDEMYVGFQKTGPVLTTAEHIRADGTLCWIKLSEVEKVKALRTKLLSCKEIVATAPEATEMMMQREFLDVADEITTRIA